MTVVRELNETVNRIGFKQNKYKIAALLMVIWIVAALLPGTFGYGDDEFEYEEYGTYEEIETEYGVYDDQENEAIYLPEDEEFDGQYYDSYIAARAIHYLTEIIRQLQTFEELNESDYTDDSWIFFSSTVDSNVEFLKSIGIYLPTTFEAIDFYNISELIQLEMYEFTLHFDNLIVILNNLQQIPHHLVRDYVLDETYPEAEYEIDGEDLPVDEEEDNLSDTDPSNALAIIVNIFELVYEIFQLNESHYTEESWEFLKTTVDESFEVLEEIGLNVPSELDYISGVMVDVMESLEIIAQEIDVLEEVYENLTDAFNWLEFAAGVYVITFYPNGGILQDGGQFRHTTDYRLLQQDFPGNPSRIGYAFLHWNTEPDGEGYILTPELEITEATAVYAIWGYSVHFFGGGVNLPLSGDLQPGDSGYDEWREAYDAFVEEHGEDWRHAFDVWWAQYTLYQTFPGIFPHPGPRPPEGPSRVRDTPAYPTNFQPRVARIDRSIEDTEGMSWVPIPERMGHVFIGWMNMDYTECPEPYENGSLEEICEPIAREWFDENTPITRNIHLEAQWEVAQIQRIYFIGTPGTLHTISGQVPYRDVVVGARRGTAAQGVTQLFASNEIFDTNAGVPNRDRTPIFTHDSFALAGWYTADGVRIVVGSSASVTNGWYSSNDIQIPASISLDEPLRLYARWHLRVDFAISNTPRVLWPNAHQFIDFGSMLNAEDFPIPELYGFEFGGWFNTWLNANPTTPVAQWTEAGRITENTVFNESTTVFARWIPKDMYTITFNIGPAGFASWTGNTPGIPTIIDGNLIITRRVLDGDTFRHVPRYDYFPGTTAPSFPSGMNRSNRSIPLNLPTRSGYVFMGWYDAVTNERFTAYDSVTRNMTLVARWVPTAFIQIVNISPNEVSSSNTSLFLPVGYSAADLIARQAEAVGIGNSNTGGHQVQVAPGNRGLPMETFVTGLGMVSGLPTYSRPTHIGFQFPFELGTPEYPLPHLPVATTGVYCLAGTAGENCELFTPHTEITGNVQIEPLWLARVEMNDNLTGTRAIGGAGLPHGDVLTPQGRWHVRNVVAGTSVASDVLGEFIYDLVRYHHGVETNEFLALTPRDPAILQNWIDAQFVHMSETTPRFPGLNPQHLGQIGTAFLKYGWTEVEPNGFPSRDEFGKPIMFDEDTVIYQNTRLNGYYIQGFLFRPGAAPDDAILPGNSYRQGSMGQPIGYENWPADPIWPEHYFWGWNTAPDGTGTWVSYYTDLWAAIPLYAIWEATFHFHANFPGGVMYCDIPDTYPIERELCPPPGSAQMPVAVGFPLGQRFSQIHQFNLPDRPNWHFSHWNTDPLGTGISYTATAPLVTVNRHVYAQWGGHVRFEFTGGRLYDSESTATHYLSDLILERQAFGVTESTVIRSGFEFVEFNSQPDGNGHVFDLSRTMTTGDVTYYAIWLYVGGGDIFDPPITGITNGVGISLTVALVGSTNIFLYRRYNAWKKSRFEV